MERISTHQFMTIVAAVLMGGTYLIISGYVTAAGGRDGWMVVLPALAVTIPYGLMILSLSAQYPQKNLLHISETLFGKWIGKIIGIIYILISVYYGGLVLAVIGFIYQQSIMTLVPLWVFYLGGLLLVFYLVSSGIEVFARFTEVVFPLVVIGLVLNIYLSVPRIEQGELLPLLGDGLKPLFWAGIKVLPFGPEFLLFLAGITTFLPTSKQDLAQLKNGLWRAVFLVGIINTLVVLIQILVFGPFETMRLSFGILVLGKIVEISRTVAGIESLFLGIWLGSLVIKTSAYFFMTIWGIETVFKLKGLKWRLAVSIVFLGIAFGIKSGTSVAIQLSLMQTYLILPFVFVWIPTLWGVSRWKKRTSVQ